MNITPPPTHIRKATIKHTSPHIHPHVHASFPVCSPTTLSSCPPLTRYLTTPSATKRVVHLALDISGSTMHYKPGDSIGIAVHNDDTLVEAIIKRLGVEGDRVFAVAPAEDDGGTVNGNSGNGSGGETRLLPHLQWPCTLKHALTVCCVGGGYVDVHILFMFCVDVFVYVHAYLHAYVSTCTYLCVCHISYPPTPLPHHSHTTTRLAWISPPHHASPSSTSSRHTAPTPQRLPPCATSQAERDVMPMPLK